jgi:hypothetical protein
MDQSDSPFKAVKYRIALLLLGSAALILYLSLRPSPNLEELDWIPRWLSKWGDTHGELRTGVPFFVLSFYIGSEACLAFPKSRSLPALMWLLGFYGLMALLFLAELSQIPMAHRHFTWGDIGFGCLGIILGAAPVFVRGLLLPNKAKTPDKDR